MKWQVKKPLDFPVLVHCMPDDPRAAGEVTWTHPNFRGRWAVRLFGRSDVDHLAGELSEGQRKRFMSILGLLQGVAGRDQSKITQARQRLDQAASLIQKENMTLAKSLLSMAGHSVPVVAGERKAVLQVEPNALADLAARLMRPDGPPMPEQADPIRVLSAEITSELRHVKFVVWCPSAQPKPALYSSTNLAAAYAFSLLGRWVGWIQCVNCGEFFRQTRPNQKWCSEACGNAYRVRKSQAKKRAETANAKTKR
jgi:hypothetical protein